MPALWMPIHPPYDNKVKEDRLQGVKRIFMYFIFLPLMIVAGTFVMRYYSADLSRAHKDVRLYDMVKQQETNPRDKISLELESFYGQGGKVDDLKNKVEVILKGLYILFFHCRSYDRFSIWTNLNKVISETLS